VQGHSERGEWKGLWEGHGGRGGWKVTVGEMSERAQ